jgi:hypothetical protein
MPLTDALIVSVVTLAFCVFALVLAWGDYQSSHAERTGEKSINKGYK